MSDTQVIIPPDDPLPDPADRTLIAPDKIAEDLKAAILANGTLAAAYTVTRYGSTLHIVKTTGDFTPYVADTLENTGLSLIKGSVQGAEQLPAQAPEGHRLLVTGDPTTNVDDYWMKFSSGKWDETIAPGLLQNLTPARMPWRLSSTGTGESRAFTFAPAAWDIRNAGDNSSNPLPPLDTIDTLFVTEGRLGFTSGANVVLSASNEPLRIFRRSVAQLIPSDPVSVRSTLGNVGRYHAVLEWDGAVQLWSEQAQRALYGSPAITPSTIAIDPTSAFESDPSCLPIVVGTRIYFSRFVDGETRVFEYHRPPGYDSLPVVTDLTITVPTYIEGEARALIADESLGFLAVVLKGASNTLYVCNVREGSNGIVPLWHRWQFNGTIASARMIGSQLVLMLNRSGALSIESLDVANPADTASGAVTDVGGYSVQPEYTLDAVYVQDKVGPDATARVTVRNMTIFHKNTRAASVVFSGETDARVTITSLIASAPIRVPVMRTLESLGFTIRWTGFLTNIEMQGTQVSRSRRV